VMAQSIMLDNVWPKLEPLLKPWFFIFSF
jgi:hypothetical protein